MKKQTIYLFIGVLAGALLTTSLQYLWRPVSPEQTAAAPTATERKPLYWVAPMDADYRRDQPGKSPMGMDLVPVYAETDDGNDAGAGTIQVSPDVINNLGVKTAAVQRMKFQQQIDTVGYVAYDQDKLVHLHPRVEGWIEKLYVNAIGDRVNKDQLLYEIYSPELVNAQQELLLALERNNERLLRAAENRLAALQLSPQAITALKKTRQVQQRVAVRAPQNGVIETLNIREGFFVKPSTTLMAIGDLSEVWVEAEVFERQASQVHAGAPVTMQLDYLPGQRWQGKVDYVYPTLEAQTRTVKVRLRFDNSKHLFKPNMFAQIAIQIVDEQPTLLIPKQALIRTGNQDRVVLALGQGKFKSIAVTVGRFDRDHAEVLAGLDEGERVVSSAQFLLDSESSKSSDFTRMSHQDDVSMAMAEQPAHVSRASTTGVINSLMAQHGMINISRAAIEKWGRPAATVDFITAEGVDLTPFNVGQQVQFTFEVRDGEFVITEISALDANGGQQ